MLFYFPKNFINETDFALLQARREVQKKKITLTDRVSQFFSSLSGPYLSIWTESILFTVHTLFPDIVIDLFYNGSTSAINSFKASDSNEKNLTPQTSNEIFKDLEDENLLTNKFHVVNQIGNDVSPSFVLDF